MIRLWNEDFFLHPHSGASLYFARKTQVESPAQDAFWKACCSPAGSAS
jgi:hypothetical protein